jgi:multiple sugar transport system permease protein
LLDAVLMSTQTKVGKPGEAFVGLQNYRDLLVGGEFWDALGVTTWYVLGTVPLALMLSFFIASLLFQKLRGLGMFRTLYFLPYVTSTVAAAMVWRWIFSPGDRGLANILVGWFGGDPLRWYSEHAGVFQMLADHVGWTLPSWAAGPSLALVCVMIFSIWHTLGFDVVIFLAGLSAIPRETYEAADVDGAGSRQKMWYITLPLLTPTLFFLAIISVIRSFQTFNQIYILTYEESVGSTQNLTMLIFNKFYNSFDYGHATAAAVLLFFVIMGLTLVQMRVLGRRVHY